ncbi:MAG TPA: 6-pyruvoyl-tetrahydropterin synthase-related protein [Anaerolineae bacterium]|nr:6-pyruvoyl-tetrahydropterin synthase-related protein [Anaerolineae bacterium]
MARSIQCRLRRCDTNLLLVVALTVFAIAPLFQPGFFWGAHDARHSVYFLYEFDRSIQDGILYPRWSPDITFGYGYPLFNIYGPLAFYLGETFHLLGLDLLWAIKMVFATSFVLSGLTMYLFVRRLMGGWAGLIAGLVYVYVPYHIGDIYMRGAFAESVALVFFPLILWTFYETVENPRPVALAGGALSYAGLVFSHNGLLLLFSPFLGIYLVFLVVSRAWQDVHNAGACTRKGWVPLARAMVKRGWAPLASLLLGLGLSSLFWLPMAFEFKYVRLDQWLGGYYDYRDDFVYFFQFFSPFWGHGLSRPGPHDDLSFQIGAVPVILSVFSLAAVARMRDRVQRRMTLFFQVSLVAIVFLMLSASTAFWELLPIVIFAQFPWRLLALVMPCVAFLAGSVVANERQPRDDRGPTLATWGLTILIIVASYAYLSPQIIEPVEGPVSLAGMMRFMQSSNQMTGSVAWTHEIPTWSAFAEHVMMEGEAPDLKVDLAELPKPRRRLAVDLQESTTISQELWVHAEEEGRIIFNVFYYPGWQAYILDGLHGEIQTRLEVMPHGSLGRVSVSVPKGEHYLLLRFEDTPVRVVGQLMSVTSLLTTFAILGWGMYGRARDRA